MRADLSSANRNSTRARTTIQTHFGDLAVRSNGTYSILESFSNVNILALIYSSGKEQTAENECSDKEQYQENKPQLVIGTASVHPKREGSQNERDNS